MPIREKKIYSGPMLEVEMYQISKEDRRQSRRKKEKLTKPAQRNLNFKNARKHFTRLLNTNFDDKDVHLTLTYRDDDLPINMEQASKDFRNFIRRVKYRRKKQGLPELKYMAVLEQSGDDGRATRAHHHVIMSGDMDRDELEAIWKKGRCNASRLQPDDHGLEGLAKYLTKKRKAGKLWTQSRNLKQPTVKTNDWKISRRKFYNYAADDCEVYYPDYELTRIEKTANNVTGYMSISILMRRRE